MLTNNEEYVNPPVMDKPEDKTEVKLKAGKLTGKAG
jgi:hypothetical protein